MSEPAPAGGSTKPRTLDRIVLFGLVAIVALALFGKAVGGVRLARRLSRAAAIGGPTGAALAADEPIAFGGGDANDAGAGIPAAGLIAGLIVATLISLVVIFSRLPRRPRVPARWGLGDFLGLALFYVLLMMLVAPLVPRLPPALGLAIQIVANLVTVLLAVQIARSRGAAARDLGFVVPTDDPSAGGLDARPTGRRVAVDVVRGVVAYVATTPGFFAIALAAVAIALAFGIPPVRHPVEQLLSGGAEEGAARVVLVVVAVTLAVVIAPLTEEAILRGFLTPALERQVGPAAAVAIQAALFASLHPGIHAMAPLFVLGCLFGALFVRTRSLIAPVAAHAAHNLLIVSLALLGGAAEVK